MGKSGKLEAFIQHILGECEKEGLSIKEIERLPQALKFAISDSISEQISDTPFIYRIPVLQESCGSDGCSR